MMMQYSLNGTIHDKEAGIPIEVPFSAQVECQEGTDQVWGDIGAGSIIRGSLYGVFVPVNNQLLLVQHYGLGTRATHVYNLKKEGNKGKDGQGVYKGQRFEIGGGIGLEAVCDAKGDGRLPALLEALTPSGIKGESVEIRVSGRN